MDPDTWLVIVTVGVLLFVTLPIAIWGNGRVGGGSCRSGGNMSADDLRRAIYQGQLDYQTLWGRQPVNLTNHRFNQPTIFKGDS